MTNFGVYDYVTDKFFGEFLSISYRNNEENLVWFVKENGEADWEYLRKAKFKKIQVTL